MNETESLDTQEESTEDFNIFRYVQLFWRHKFFIAFLGLLFGLPTAYVAKDWPNTYEATASLLILDGQTSNLTNIEGLYGINTQSRTYTTNQYEILKSRNLAERVIEDLNLLEHPEFSPTTVNPVTGETIVQPPANREEKLLRVLNAFQRRLVIRPVNNTSIVRVSFSSTDPQLAADIANQVAMAYIEQEHEQRLEATQQASLWLSDRASALNHDLRESEAKLQAFLEREQLIDMGGVTSLINQEIDSLALQLIDSQRTRREAENIYRQVQDLKGANLETLLTSPYLLNHTLVQDARAGVSQVEREIAELSNRYGRNHPRMIALRAELEDANSNLFTVASQVASTIENQYLAALDNERATEAQLEASKAKLQAINSTAFERQELEREVATNRQLYEMFFTRIRETQETDDLQTTNASIVDPAVPAIYPTGPQRKKTVLLALAAGLALGAGLVLLRDLLNNTIRSYQDIEHRLKRPVLGIVPLVKVSKRKKKKNEPDLIKSCKNPDFIFRESFRTIRTGVLLSSIDQPYKTISITSCLPEEGKTSVSINLAYSLAQMGRKVLLVDVDLRKSTMAAALGLPKNSPGLSDYIIGTNELEDVLHNFDNSLLTILPAGKRVPDPLELVSSDIFKTLIDTLSREYDHIILDTPPTAAVSDSLIIGKVSQATVFVVRSESTPLRLAKKQLERLKQARINVIGVILNQFDTKKATDDYGGYYDAYGYSDAEPPREAKAST